MNDEISALLRPNIRSLAPYSSARDEYAGHDAHVFLDANESPYGAPYNRYPDPLQRELKEAIARVKGIPADHIFVGNGSDEPIDLLYRCFCEPGRDNVVAIAPTYGMYRVCADINDVEYRDVPLGDQFQLSADRILQACDSHTKVVWLCSPNNPTGNSLQRDEMLRIVDTFPGIVVIDEAYSDFARQQPLRHEVLRHERLVVLNTMSKAWASAAIRLGMAFAHPAVVSVLNKVKYPYNVNLLTQQEALRRLADTTDIERWLRLILQERTQTIDAFRQLPLCREVFPTDANFFLARVTDANAIYSYLVQQGIIVRNRSRVQLCDDCLRITIGTRSENAELLAALRQYQP